MARAGNKKRGGIGRESDRRESAGARESWLRGKRPVLTFVVILAGATLGFNALFYLWFSRLSAFDAYLSANARLSAAILRLCGGDVSFAGQRVVSPDFAMDIQLGCDGIQSSAFFLFAVLASPLRTPFRARLLPIAAGVVLLLALNLVRLVTLFWTGVYFPGAFEVMHVEVWQAVFILLPLLLWLLWVRREVAAAGRRLDGAQ